MQCAKCQKESVVFQPYSGMYLCRNHFIADIEAKAKRDIRTHRWLQSGDHIGIIVQEDSKSIALVHFLASLVANRRDVKITAVIFGDERPGSRDDSCIRCACEGAGKAGIACVFTHRYGTGESEEMRSRSKIGEITDCMTAPGIQSQLTVVAQEYGITKYAASRCLDDAALSTLVNILIEIPEDFWNAGTICGNIQVMTPFLSATSSEVKLYAELATGTQGCESVEENCDAFTGNIRDLLDTYTARHPATKYSLMHLAEGIRCAGQAPGRSHKNQKEVKGRAE